MAFEDQTISLYQPDLKVITKKIPHRRHENESGYGTYRTYRCKPILKI